MRTVLRSDPRVDPFGRHERPENKTANDTRVILT